ncbi:Alpha/beta hydrolase fold-1 [Colletotrichum navitas]|uniref:Alpha/beta hydrolase fold-1 n=1 Tax=Colletotrichum navitas TaxID=681940 RepID=A0AAD8V151_9PEZI|nr:Alpha/beta hydrolase fold-1 [Colletotrichum navitas]KAK1573959.1 Alpha/beta hydrolase fold-1 [Colletotrichum navitas]
MPSELPTIVFIPGAWHKPWIFDLVRDDLAGRGYPTAAVSLPSVGSTDVNAGLGQDADAVRAELQRLIDAGREVVVVAHSYGGIPVANAVEGLNHKCRVAKKKTGGVLMIIYVASFAVPADESLSDSDGEGLKPWLDVKDGFVSPRDPIPIFYADVEPSLATKAAVALCPQPGKTFQDKSGFEPWNEGFEMGYIFAEDDQVIPLDKQIDMASQFPASSFTATLTASHSPFLSMPETLGKTIQQAAQVAVARKAA